MSIWRTERLRFLPKENKKSLATEVSYAKSAQIVAGGEVSRQSVRNSILRLGGIEKEAEVGKPKRRVKELHIFADEDHVHMVILRQYRLES